MLKPYKRLIAVGIVLCFALGLLTADMAIAEEPATAELSLNKAIAMALRHSKSIQKAEKEIERTEELRDYQNDQLDFIPAAPGTAYVEVPWAQMLTADLTWRMSKKQYTAEEDAVALATCQKYWEILKAQEMVRVAEKEKDKAWRQLNDAQVGCQVGIVAYPELLAAEVQYNGAKVNVETALNDLARTYEEFNQLVGLQPEDRPVLTDKVDFKPLKITDLDYEVNRVLENCPTVWLAREKVTLQEYLKDMMFYTGEYRPYKARKLEVEQAELDAASTEEMFEILTRSLYYGAKNLEEGYAGAQEGLRMAQENLRVKELMFEVGMATKSEVLSAEADVVKAKKQLTDLACQHAYMKLAFEKPWAYIGSSGGSSSNSESM